MSEAAFETNEDLYASLEDSAHPVRFFRIERPDGDNDYTYAHGWESHLNGNLVFTSNARKDLEYRSGYWVLVQEISQEEFDNA